MWRWVLSGLLQIVLAAPCLVAQQSPPRPDKPKLIRNDQITEPVEPEVVTPDPTEARRNMAVGDFYFKKGNLKAARERYREAVKYGPKIAEAYDKLVKTLEQLDQWQEALDACRQFLANNPDSDQVEEFQRKAEAIEERLAG